MRYAVGPVMVDSNSYNNLWTAVFFYDKSFIPTSMYGVQMSHADAVMKMFAIWMLRWSMS